MSTAVCSRLEHIEVVWFCGKRMHLVSEREQRHNPSNVVRGDDTRRTTRQMWTSSTAADISVTRLKERRQLRSPRVPKSPSVHEKVYFRSKAQFSIESKREFSTTKCLQTLFPGWGPVSIATLAWYHASRHPTIWSGQIDAANISTKTWINPPPLIYSLNVWVPVFYNDTGVDRTFASNISL